MLGQPKILLFDVPVYNGEGTHRLAVYEWCNPVNLKGTVFCVHGLTRNGRDFDVLASALSENYRILSVDVAGRGRSEWHKDPAHYNYADYVADISHLIKELKLSNINWIGTSMGGIIGMMIANTFPKLLRTLTLNDIGCFIPSAGLSRISEYVSQLTNFESCPAAEAELRRRCAPYGIKSEEHWQNVFCHSIQETADNRFRLAYDPAIAKNLFSPDKTVEDVNLWPLWEAVKTIPTLLIRGMDSDILTHQTSIEMEKSHPNFSLLEIENIGHAPALMDELQIGVIKRWLETH